MTDRELLELAARADGALWAGNLHTWVKWSGKTDDDKDGAWVEWLPLEDDGDALRLAVKTKVLFDIQSHLGRLLLEEGEQPSREHAVRRAIVRAAAEIQRAKEAA